jgi:hypothetical protein
MGQSLRQMTLPIGGLGTHLGAVFLADEGARRTSNMLTIDDRLKLKSKSNVSSFSVVFRLTAAHAESERSVLAPLRLVVDQLSQELGKAPLIRDRRG